MADDGSGALSLLRTLSQHGSTFDLIELEGLGEKILVPTPPFLKSVRSPRYERYQCFVALLSVGLSKVLQSTLSP